MKMKLMLILFLILLCSSCTSRVSVENKIPSGMQLVWSDEFDVDGAPDPLKWDYSIGGNGWGNGEIQKYTDMRHNSYVKDGKLAIVALNDKGMWTSSRLKTQYKGDWTYGYIEVCAKLPKGVGTWPAIWMMPTSEMYGSWPRSGEIDIVEHVGFEQDKIHTTIHTAAYNHKINTQKTASSLVKGVSNKYHVYAVEWNPEYIVWYVDGKQFFRFENEKLTTREWPFDKPFYLILNLAIGGAWGGQKGVDPDLKEAKMLIDYVRVYQ